MTGFSGSLVVLVLSEGGEVLGTFGLGKVTPYEFSEAEKARLTEIGRECRGLL